LRRIKVLHLEPTDICQAACPLCARETNPDFNKSDTMHHLKIEHIQRLYPEKTLKKLDKVFMCGNYGDPAAGKYTLDLYRYFRSINPDVTLGMNTNGGLQTTFWWYGLGKILNQPRDYCVFSIDGLEDTNATYRKNVNWDKLIANAESFISAGGSAHWDMLVYKHNQHQIEKCEKLARDMGFKWFRAKVSKRPMKYGLEAPINWQQPIKKIGAIKCHAIAEKSEYVDARGRRIPCCWLGSSLIDPITNIDDVKNTWKTDNPYSVCSTNCSVNKNQTVFEEQWQHEVELC
jgi:sulfatase maturation enzyme AslB (radical SAM superfamily)